jgi:CRISPR-associated protein (TIGR03986 family)
MSPKHLKEVPDNRKAIAPYNFVELPNEVVEAELQYNGKLRNNDRYYPDCHTGRIRCTLKTESPLYIRCGLTPNEFAAFGDKSNEDLTLEQRKKYAAFFHHSTNLHPILPGSSLRGMLRTLVEIISFGKIEKVSEQQKFFFRAVAAESDDPLKKKYTDYIGNLAKYVKAGYLEESRNKWFIRSTITIDNKSFFKVKEKDIKDHIPSLVTMEKDNYLPQYIEISFEGTPKSIKISEDCEAYQFKGVLVTSGNMLETGSTTEAERKALLSRKEGRKNHYIVFQADTAAERIEISEDAVRDYRHALTDFQKGKTFERNPKNPFHDKMGILKKGRPVFYCDPSSREPVLVLFGQSPNFRVPYSPKNDGKAASAFDFIPKEVGESDKIDLADAIFGFVRRGRAKKEQISPESRKEQREQSRAGRVFISDAQYATDEDGIWLSGNADDTITPQILASPKPTTFQHYLVQTSFEKENLNHYASQPNKVTVIRGHKLYWHKGDVKERIKTKATEAEIAEKQSQYTEIKPIKAGVSFEFTIYFENLSDVELGALLWVLTLSGQDTEKLKLLNLDGSEKYRLSLGMGKPLGMGAVTIEKYELFLNERSLNQPQQRYTQLFDGDNWLTGDRPATLDEHTHCIQKFEKYVTERISKANRSKDYSDEGSTEPLNLKDLPRIKMLLLMLRWDVFPPVARTRYMEIERDINKDYIGEPVDPTDNTVNEYRKRPVLPTPFQVMDRVDEDNRRLDNSTTPPTQSAPTHGGGGSSSAALARGKKPPKHK